MLRSRNNIIHCVSITQTTQQLLRSLENTTRREITSPWHWTLNVGTVSHVVVAPLHEYLHIITEKRNNTPQTNTSLARAAFEVTKAAANVSKSRARADEPTEPRAAMWTIPGHEHHALIATHSRNASMFPTHSHKKHRDTATDSSSS